MPPGTAVAPDLSAMRFLTLEAVVPLPALVERCAAEGKARLTVSVIAANLVRRRSG
ncbi:hypothetical protein OHS58_06105 [Amycolatopsis sp. NBC_00348]|uniref:hypothetical protein n=1 Tax=Amycolatopsis sp. NBC_00348 TaxID=2975956 RepID=UPI002E258F06